MPSTSPTRGLATALGVVLAAFVLLGIPWRDEPTARATIGATGTPYSDFKQAAILSAMAEGADFGPGFVECLPGGSNAAIRGIPVDLSVGELFLTLQNFGDCSLQVIHHSASSGGSAQVGITGPYSSGSFAFRVSPRDTLQILALTDGTIGRYAWSARARDPVTGP